MIKVSFSMIEIVYTVSTLESLFFYPKIYIAKNFKQGYNNDEND